MATFDVGAALRRAREDGPASVPDILAGLGRELGATDVVVYLVDFGQTTLEPLPDRAAHADVPAAEPVVGSMAGRAFTDQQLVTSEREDGHRAWVPVLEGSDRTGVLALTLPLKAAIDRDACEELGLLAGYLIAAQARCTDVYNLYRRRRAMTLPASMQWDLLPPLVLRTSSVVVAGLVEPAYDVGGDCFDYSINGSMLDLAVFDAMGHGLRSAVLSALAVGSYRHARREARPLAAIHDHLGATIAANGPDVAFVSGVLARLDLQSGELTWTNAGHPLPLLIRGGQVIRELDCPPTVPWGLGGAVPTIATCALEPGDTVLLYTDGVIEARTPDGELFGIERLVDVTTSHASDLLALEEVARRVVVNVLDHQRTDLRDDATVVMVRWDGESPR